MTSKFLPARFNHPPLTIARWLYKALSSAPVKRDVLINRATHVMHLEKSRYQVYREVQVFLEGRDTTGM